MAAVVRISDLDPATAPYDGATLLEASVPASGGGYTSYSITLDEITGGSSGSSGGSRVSVSDSPPASPTVGDTWFDSTTATMTYVFYDGFWVPLVNQPGPQGPKGDPGADGADGAGVFLPLSGGALSGALSVTYSSANVLIADTRPVAVGVGGAISFSGNNASSAQTIYASINSYATNGAPGAETASLFFNTKRDGIITEAGRFDNFGNLYTAGGVYTSAASTFTGNVSITGTLFIHGVGFAQADAYNSGYNKILDNTGNPTLYLGGNPTYTNNIYKQNAHLFTDRADASLAQFDTSGLQVYKTVFIDDPRVIAANNGGSLQLRAFDDGTSMAGLAVVRASLTNGTHSAVSGMCVIDTARTGILTEAVRFYDVGNMAITGDTAVKIGGGSWLAPSDGRMKRDVIEYNRGLEQVLALQPIVFSYNGKGGVHDTGSRYVGLDAGETEKVMPELVGTIMVDLDPKRDDELEPAPEPTDGTVAGPRAEIKTIDSGPLVYALLNSVKELNERIAKLEALVAGGGK